MKPDFSLANAGKFSSFAGLEITTPKMQNQTAALDECVKVARELVAHPEVRFSNSCGLHVHVGHAGEGLSLLASQKLFSVLFLGGEQILNTLFRKDRRNNYYCRDITKHSAVAKISGQGQRLPGAVPEEVSNYWRPAPISRGCMANYGCCSGLLPAFPPTFRQSRSTRRTGLPWIPSGKQRPSKSSSK